MKKIVFSIFSEDKTDINDYSKMSIKERKVSDLYMRRKELIARCCCKGTAVKMAEDGRIVDCSPEEYDADNDHLVICSRYKLKLKKIDNEDDNQIIKVSFASLFPDDENKQKSKKRNKNPNGESNRNTFKTLSFIYSISRQIYNKQKNKFDNYLLTDHSKTLYAKLNDITFLIGKGNAQRKRILFVCGPLVRIEKHENCNLVNIIYKTPISIKCEALQQSEYNRALQLFKNKYKVDPSDDQNLMMIIAIDKKTNRKNMFLYPVTNYGLACDSFLEQKFYNWLETVKLEKNKYRFIREDTESVYKGKRYRYKDDGQIYKIDDTEKVRIVIEIFGMLDNDEYKKKADDKRKYFANSNKEVLLEILPEDDEKDYKNKLIRALDERLKLSIRSKVFKERTE